MVQQPDACPTAPAHIQMRGMNFQDLSDLKACDQDPDLSAADEHQNGKAQARVDDGVGGAAGFPFQNVQVKNTFIQVKDAGETDAASQRPVRHRRTHHHRCVSWPLWTVRPFSEPNEPMQLSLMVPETEDGDGLCDFGRAPTLSPHAEIDFAAPSPADGLACNSASGSEEAQSAARNSDANGLKHVGRHLRQLSGGSTASGSVAVGGAVSGSESSMASCRPQFEGSFAGVMNYSSCSFGPDPRLSDPWAFSRAAGAAAAALSSKTLSTTTGPSESSSQGGKDMFVSSAASSQLPMGDDPVPDVIEGSRGSEDCGHSRPSHIRQLSTFSTQTADSFQHGEELSGDIQRDLADIMRMPPDPRLSDPWQLSQLQAAAAAASAAVARRPASAIPHGDDVSRFPPAPMPAPSDAQPSSARIPAAYTGAPNAAPAHFANPVVTPSPVQTSMVDQPNGLSPGMYDSDPVAAAYARGVAAGAVAAGAYARGFAAGVAAGGNVRKLPQEAQLVRPVNHGSNEKNMRRPSVSTGSREGLANGTREQEFPPCKWYARGTCKFGAECRYPHEGQIEQKVPSESETFTRPKNENTESNSPVAAHPVSARRISLEGALSQPLEAVEVTIAADADAEAEVPECQIFWCDQRAFKDTSSGLKDQLEAETHLAVKTYRTAEMCIRLLRKKRHWQSKSVTRCFLVSWANAQSLIPFLNEQQPSMSASVIILCDTCGSRGCSKAEAWAREYPNLVNAVATTWPQAVEAIKQSVWSRRANQSFQLDGAEAPVWASPGTV